MNRVQATFDSLRVRGKKALIGYLTAGYPTPEASISLLHTMADAGCDVIEFGVPFSDPVADGPAIQKATFEALKHHINVDWCLKTVREFRKKNKVTPVLLMGYGNPFMRFGIERFSREAKESGVDGIIVPDLSDEELDRWSGILKNDGLESVSFLAPTTSRKRVRQIAERASGFVYCISLAGLTGADLPTISNQLRENIEELRLHSSVPTALGFGIQTPEQAAKVASLCDGIIVGTAIINTISEGPLETSLLRLAKLISDLKAGLELGASEGYQANAVCL